MATPAMENIIKVYPDAKITIFGAGVSVALFETHPNVEKSIVDKSKTSSFRALWLFRMTQNLPEFDIALSFRSSLYSKMVLFFLKAEKKAHYVKGKRPEYHQVLRYNDFANSVVKHQMSAGDLKIYLHPMKYKKPTLGINPGASYGSAKRWYPEKFAAVAVALSTHYDIVLFGGPSELDMAEDIEEMLKRADVKNYTNMAGKTTIGMLCEKIGGLDMFITGDSGPMHVAAAFKVPTVALFGPTKEGETSAWHHPWSMIVKHPVECAPCMQRTCPLKHHECMKLIGVEDVLRAVEVLKKRHDHEKTV